MSQEIVGKIDGYDVIYVSEKDIIFCKNTTLPYAMMKAALIDGMIDRLDLKEDLVMTIDGEIVRLACLTTTLENCRKINKKVNKFRKIKKHGNNISKTSH